MTGPSASQPPMMARHLPAEGAAVPVRMAHVVLKTARPDAVARWYQHVFGARLVFGNEMIRFLTFDTEHHRIALLNTAALKLPDPAPGSDRIDHIAWTYQDLGDLLATYYRLLPLGIAPVRTINHGPTISFYYRDPDGVMSELQVDNFASPAEAEAFFTSPEFTANPIGVFVDPDELRAQWEAGVPWEEIRLRPPLPAGKSPLDMRQERHK